MTASMAAADIPVGDHRDLLDIIDSLRSQGVSQYVDLPEIIVCGDQSAGKSSVLEAISGMPFPTKDGLCTRFATELVLRRGPETSIRVSITPGEGRYGKEKDDLESWRPQTSIKKGDLGAVTEEAKFAMSATVDKEFYDDILRIELIGPTLPHLTMVDLPGLFRAGNKEQSDADVDTVRGMVKRYMARPRSVILAVVSAKNEYVLQEVTSMAKLADPAGLRTMGLITKPDTLDVGSDSENSWLRLAQNIDVELRLGWHVLRNRNFEQRGSSSADRDAVEEEFFSKGIWNALKPSHCGVVALKTRLSSILKDLILSQLPSLAQDVEDSIRNCTNKLKRLGPIRRSPEDQMKYLMHLSENYTSVMTQAVEGAYIEGFFGGRNRLDGYPAMLEAYPTRLRAVVQNRLTAFGQELRSNGKSQHIFDDTESESEGEDEIGDSPRISRSHYVENVARRLKFNKGRELPGLFNPLIVGDLFVEQCKPWRKIVTVLVDEILEAAHQTTQLVVTHVAASDVADGLFKLLHDRIERLKSGLDAKIDELLASFMQHPITYNRQLTDNVQKAQQARHKRAIEKLVRNTFGSERFDNPDSKITVNPVQFVKILTEGREPDMERFGSSMAVDYMEAYYDATMNRFIDDVSVLAIENCLIGKLSELFRSHDVLDMSTEDISRLAGETEESSIERYHLEQKSKILETGLQRLKGLQEYRHFARPAKRDAAAPEDSVHRHVKTSSSSEKASTATSVRGASPVMPFQDEPAERYVQDVEPLTEPRIERGMSRADSQTERVDEWESWPRRPKGKKKFGYSSEESVPDPPQPDDY